MNRASASTLAAAAAASAILASACAHAAGPAVPPAPAPAAPAVPPLAPGAKPTAAQALAASKPEEWRALDPANTLYLELPAGRVVIELAPRFAPQHVGNLELLVREGYFDGTSVLRAQDNYVAQWGDATEKRPIKTGKEKLPAEFAAPLDEALQFTRLPDGDVYAPVVGHSLGFPVAHDPVAGLMWLAHCYGMVGAGRDTDAGSGSGSSLYAVIGHAPRHLDRNVTLLGRVVWGIELLSTLRRGPAPMGFYEKPEEMTAVKAARLAADLPAAERTDLELLRTDSATFAAVTEARRNNPDPWTQHQTGRIELCNAQLPVRRAAQK
jgi:peptidylprolyl isomerase